MHISSKVIKNDLARVYMVTPIKGGYHQKIKNSSSQIDPFWENLPIHADKKKSDLLTKA